MILQEAWYDIRWKNLRLEDWLIILRAGFNRKYEKTKMGEVKPT